ncbi:SUMO-conjugating enzyme UBC9 [Entamoeba marina]
MAQSIATSRIVEERRAWRKDHPPGFIARPKVDASGVVDLFHWECLIPGKKGTLWEGEYPALPPRCYLPKNFFHPNIFPNGQICLSILNESYDWKPTITIRQILVGVQDLLDNPNKESPAQGKATKVFCNNLEEYKRLVIKERNKYLKDTL